MFKEQARVEMPLKVYKVPASQKAVPTRLKYQQHCDFLFCLYHSLVYNEPFTCLGQGSCHFPLWFEKVCFRVVCLMLYTQELSIHGVPKNLQEIRKIRLELLKIDPGHRVGSCHPSAPGNDASYNSIISSSEAQAATMMVQGNTSSKGGRGWKLLILKYNYRQLR